MKVTSITDDDFPYNTMYRVGALYSQVGVMHSYNPHICLEEEKWAQMHMLRLLQLNGDWDFLYDKHTNAFS